MKIRLKLTFLSLLITVMVNAQGIYNNGGKIVIGSGAVVHINGSTGNLRNETSGGDGAVLLSGTLRLGGNLTNNVAAAGVFTTPAAGSEVILNGSAAQTLGGSSTAAFASLNQYGTFWTSTNYSTIYAWYSLMNYNGNTCATNWGFNAKTNGLSVRCVKD